MLGVIASSRSGQNRRRPERLEQLRCSAEAGGALFDTPDGLDTLRVTLQAFADAGVTTLAVNGGDGTLHRVITAAVAVLPELPTFAVLPGGTMNIVARSTGWLGRAPEALQRVIDGRTLVQERQLLQVGELYGFLWGNGLLARFLEVYEEGETTPVRAAGILARGAFSALVGGAYARRLTQRWMGTVELDGELLERADWLAVAAGTVEQIGLGFRPFRHADKVGQMHAVGLGSSVARFAFELPRVYLRQPLVAPNNVERAVQKLVLRAPEPIGFMFDGDFHRGGTELTVALGPTVRLLAPA